MSWEKEYVDDLASRKLSDGTQNLIAQLVSKDDPENIYELTERLGKGSHGVVYKATNRITGDVVAIKKLMNVQLDENELKDSLKEIQILKDLDNPYCIEYYNSYFKGGDLWIAMEFFDAGSIGDLMAIRKAALSESQIRMIVYQVLRGLNYLHTRNMIHRDIKAGNILLNKQGRVKLADFGIAAVLDANETRKQTQIGSPFWMSPELILGEGYDQKTDIWSLGVTIIEMAQPQHPFFDANPLTAVFAIVSEDPPELSDTNCWSVTFTDFLALCLLKDPVARSPSSDLLKHPFMVNKSQVRSGQLFGAKADGGEKTMRKEDMDIGNGSQELAEQYLGFLQKMGSNLAIRGENPLGEDENEAIMRIYLQDGSYRSVLVKQNETSGEIVERLKGKLGVGSEKGDRWALFKFQFENERVVDAKIRLLDLLKSSSPSPNSAIRFSFKELPDTETFEHLTSILSKLRNLSNTNKVGSSSEHKQLISEFINVIIEKDNLNVVTSLCYCVPKTRIDSLVLALIKLFGFHRKLVALFKKLCSKEVATTVAVSGLFLADSIVGKLVSGYGKMVGLNYLKTILKPTFRLVFQLRDPLEVDPNRVGDVVKIQENVEQLKNISRMLLNDILESVSQIPKTFRIICKELHEIVTSCFPTRQHVVVSSFLFVRFICPAIVSPYNFGIIGSPPTTLGINRTLVLLSKTIQALATGHRFGKREAYMSNMNQFVDEHRGKLENFFKLVIDLDDKEIQTTGTNGASGVPIMKGLPVNRKLQTLSLDKLGRRPSIGMRGVVEEEFVEKGKEKMDECQEGTDEVLVLPQEEIEDALTVLFGLLEDNDILRRVGQQMDVLPKPPSEFLKATTNS